MANIRFPGLIPQIGDYAYTLPIGVSPLGNLLIDDILFPSGYSVTRWDVKELSSVQRDYASVISRSIPSESVDVSTLGWERAIWTVVIPFSCQACAIMVNQQKNIVMSTVNGRNGTVKEYIGMGDYQISIQGKISNILSVFPVEMLGLFHELVKVPHSIPIENKFLNKLDINKVVIQDISVNPIVGVINEFEFTMNLLSDDNDINFEKFIL